MNGWPDWKERLMKLIIYRQDNAWHVSFEGSMMIPFKHLDRVIDYLQRRYPGAKIEMPEPICGTREERPNLRIVK